MVRTRGVKIGAALVRGAMLALLFSGVGCGLLSQKKDEKKGFGLECAKDTDCESSQCATYGSICTKACTYDRECGDGLVCRTKDTGSGLVCSKPAGSKVGASCTTATECDHGYCLKKADAPNDPGFCSRTCQGGEDCPDGFKICDTITDSGETKMCIVGDDKIPIGERPKLTAPKPVVVNTKTAPTTDAGAPPPVVDAGAPPVVDAGTTRPVIDAGTTTRPVIDAGLPAPAVDAGTRPRITIKFPVKK